MFLTIANVLSDDEVKTLMNASRSAQFVSGKVSNPHTKVKNNEQINFNDPLFKETSGVLARALFRNQEFVNFAFPVRIAPPMICKYRPDMNYGVHADSAILPFGQEPLRSDVSCTIFLSDPSTYEGGELTSHLGNATVAHKEEPGTAVVYPSTTLHEVRPVTSGERVVAVTFIQSRIRDSFRREMLYSLNEVAAIEGFNISWESRTRLEQVRNNLLRMWADD